MVETGIAKKIELTVELQQHRPHATAIGVLVQLNTIFRRQTHFVLRGDRNFPGAISPRSRYRHVAAYRTCASPVGISAGFLRPASHWALGRHRKREYQ